MLPPGVRSTQVSFGFFGGVGQRFNQSGRLESITSRYRLNLNGKTLSTLSTDLKRLVNGLNSYSTLQPLGELVNVGEIQFQSDPSIEYIVPSFAIGLTPKLTIGFGIPVIKFRNKVKAILVGGNNISEIRDYAKNVSQDVDEGLDKLQKAANEIHSTVQSVAAERGYRSIGTTEFVGIGDVVLSGVYRYYESTQVKLALRPFVQLPTGRPDDPDDLVDTAIGGQPAVGLYSIHDFPVSSGFTVHSSLGYVLNFEDYVDVRVPTDDSDVLPGLESKEYVRRDAGDLGSVEVGASQKLLKDFSLSGFYQWAYKQRDIYSGNRNLKYALLAEDTEQYRHSVFGRLEYSTVRKYQANSWAIPLILSYTYGNTLLAKNALNESSHEISLRMFF